MRRAGAIAVAAAALAAAPARGADAPAPPSATADALSPAALLASAGVGLEGGIFTSYPYDLARPAGRTGVVPMRAFDVDQNTFVLDLAELAVKRDLGAPHEWGDLGFRLELAFGRIASFIDPGPANGKDAVAFAVHQAFVAYRLPLEMQVDLIAGRFATPIGLESMEPWLDANTSHGPLITFAGPITHTGLGLRLTPREEVSYTQYVVNGWDVVEDNNDGKTALGQLTAAPPLGKDAALSLMFVWCYGAEQKDRAGPKRLTLEGAATLALFERVTLTLDALYGHEDEAALAGGGADWQVVSGGASWKVLETVKLSSRLDYFRDPEGARTGAAQELKSATLTLEKTMPALGRLVFGARLEVRADWSNAAVFPRGTRQDAATSQTTAGASLYVTF